MANSAKTPANKSIPHDPRSQSGYDMRMLIPCYLAPQGSNPNRPGPGRTVEDDPQRARYIDELLKRRIH